MSIKKNFIYNVILTLSTYVANLIIFPYVSRVLGVENIGAIGFVSNVIQYFILFSTLGISVIGIREIAACEDNKEKRSAVFSSLLSLLFLFTFIVTVIYGVVIFTVPQFSNHKELFFIGTAQLIFSALLIEWFYQGIEQFKFISLRNILLKVLYVIAVFLFVKSKSDYIVYFSLTVGVVVLNALINLSYSRKYISFSLGDIQIKKYFKQIFSLGVYRILTSMYTTFNVIYLGMVCNDMQVGYYYTSTKIFYILMGILGAFTQVMLPRMSSLIADGKIEEFKSMIQKSFNLVFSLTFPVVAFTVIFASQIIYILSGKGYEGAIVPMQIIMPMIFLTGVAQILVIQVLLPLKKDNVILVASIIGAFVGIVSNVLIVKQNGAVGSAIVLLASEIFADLFCFFYIIKKDIIPFPYKGLWFNFLNSIPYIVFCLLALMIVKSTYFVILLSGLLCLAYFIFSQLFIMKNEFIIRFVASNLKIKILK